MAWKQTAIGSRKISEKARKQKELGKGSEKTRKLKSWEAERAQKQKQLGNGSEKQQTELKCS